MTAHGIDHYLAQELGSMFPVVTIPISLAQGFGEERHDGK